MREVTSPEEVLLVCKALSSEIRMKIVSLLNKNQSMNLNELSDCLGVTNGAMTSHVKILSEANIIDIQHSSGKRGSQKTCSLKDTRLLLHVLEEENLNNTYETEIPIGQYGNYSVMPTCGIATKSSIIGEVDDNRYFDSPQRTEAGILWFTKGFLEYRIPNYLKQGQVATEIQLSFEISSEAPGICANWPSDIYFYLNDHCLGYWTSPGDFGDTKGLYAPAWWPSSFNQYGLLKLLSINEEGTFVDGHRISDLCVHDIALDSKSEIRLRFSVGEHDEKAGGLTLFGQNFGNYNQDIKARISFRELREN